MKVVLSGKVDGTGSCLSSTLLQRTWFFTSTIHFNNVKGTLGRYGG